MEGFFMVFLFLLVSCICGILGGPVPCSHPSNSTLSQQLVHLNFYGYVPPAGESLNTISSDSVTHEHLFGDQSCPSEPSSSPNADVNDRSVCPWYYVLNHDPKRYPATFPEARCRCTECIRNNRYQCERVFYSIQVLQQTDECENNVYVYKPAWVKIAVGCTCAMPRTSEAGPIDNSGPDV